MVKEKEEQILVVDDEEVVRNLLFDILNGEGYSVHSANNGAEAMNRLQNGNFDLVITDIKMPDMNGLELMQKMRKTYPELIVLIMTGYASVESARIAIKEGAFDYIMKPFNMDEIKLAISNAIDRYKMTRENAKLRETMALFEISNALAKTIILEDLYQLILTSALNQIDATRGSLMILDEMEKKLVIKASVGIEDEIVKQGKLNLGEGIAGQIAEGGKPLLITDVTEHHLFNKLSHQFPDKSFISIPLIGAKEEELFYSPRKAKENVIGVLNLNKPKTGKTFTKGDLHLLTILANQAAISIENAKLFKNLEEIYLSTMKSLALILEGKSPYTRGHSERVTMYTLKIAAEMKLSSKEIYALKCGAILHDIGKIGISDSILNKPDQLTDDEFKAIKEHPAIGYNMMKPIRFLKEALPIIRNHHERIDGKGYPDGLSGENICCLARICMVADSYDAMTSDRPYRKLLSRKVILSEFDKNSGTQFDKEIVAALIKIESLELNAK